VTVARRWWGNEAFPAPTAAGAAVLGGSLVAHAVGWGLGYGELLTVAAAGYVALLVAALWTWSRPRLEVSRTLTPQRVVRGERADAVVGVANRGRRPLAALVARDRVGERVVEVALPRVAAGSDAAVRYELPTTRRGVVPVGPLAVVRRDPLGLLVAARRFGATDTLWVYPRLYPVVPPSAGTRRDLEGPTSDGAAGSITFHALREYVVGDDLRLIHWRSTARTGTLMIRQQADPSQPQTTVVLDTHRASYDEDTFESAVEAAASLIAACSAHRFPVRLHTGAGLVTGGLLDHLTPLAWSDTGRLADVAARLAAEPAGHSLVVVTGDPDPGDLLAVEAQRQRYDSLAVVRFRRDVPPGASSNAGVTDIVAPDAGAFAALWNR
jgi:uncharacterized protein (DUF58 family)